MSAHDPSDRLDLHALEARTQAIGRELFASAKREHAHLSVLNRWTARVLSWCLADPSLKSAVLRFIDVLPSLRTPREVARHVLEYFPTTDAGTTRARGRGGSPVGEAGGTSRLRLPAALRIGASLARPGLLTEGALATLIRQSVEQVARQFIAESSPEGARRVIHELAARGATCSLDLLGEQVLSEREAQEYVEQCARLLGEADAAYAELPPATRLSSCGPRANLSVKPSALTPRFEAISPPPSVARAVARLAPLLQQAATLSATVHLDMEQYELRDLTVALTKVLLEAAPHTKGVGVGASPTLGIVIQAYLRDAEAVTEDLLTFLAQRWQPLAVRLVKGAYWDYEVARAQQCRWRVPVHENKGTTDAVFERLTRRLLGAHPLVTTAIASHNVRSIAQAMAVAETLGLPKDQLEFQLLYGMGDALHAAIVQRGYPVRIYTPIGELIPGMAYLVRRLLENTANESFLRQEFLEERSADDLLRPPADAAGGGSRAMVPWRGEALADFAQSPQRHAMAEALGRVRARLGGRYPLRIGPRSVETSEWLTSRNPAQPAHAIGLVARASVADVQQAVQLAAEAQPQWAATPVRERVALMRRAADLLRAARWDLAAWEVLEAGKPWREADADVVEAIDFVEYYSQGMEALTAKPPLLQALGERNDAVYVPRGIAAVIAPWNFPAAILTGMASAALVSGNAVILKPAEQSSVIAAHIARLFAEAGIPPGIVQFLPGIGEEAGSALVRHPGVHTILFTGSKAVGLAILEASAKPPGGQRFIKQVVAEMGGKNAIIVDADADLDAAIGGILRSAFGYGGQKCSAASRLIVHEAVYERLLPRLVAAADRLVVGDPADPDTDMGPLIEEAAQWRLREAVEHAREVAAVTYEYPLARLPSPGYFVGPTVVTDVPRDDRLAKQELFGPLLCVFRVKTFEEALALANDSDYALTGGVYSRSPSHLARAVQAFDVGNLYLNRPITGAMVGRQPFGGHRLSGLGTKAGGPDYLLHLLLPKTICTDTSRHGMPLE